MTVKKAKRRWSGLTLADTMMATIVLSIVAAAVLVPFASGTMIRKEGECRTLAAKLAMDLMQKVVNTDFANIVGTYNYTEGKGLVKNCNGVVLTDSRYAKFSRSVSSSYVYVSQESGAQPAQFILVTACVYYDEKKMAEINRLIGR